MSYYRNDYVVTKNENGVVVDVGDKKEWTWFDFELGEDILKNIQSLERGKWLKAIQPNGDKIEAHWSEREGPKKVFIVLNEKMLGGTYEESRISILYSDLFE